ncbi:MAG: ArnT family glycosyltransferase [Methylobacter sp.]
MHRLTADRVWIFLLWGILTFITLLTRPLFPVDETRYAAVAWEMWLRNDFLVPYLNGETYSHKPPLLFWLMQLSWWLLGVNDWSLRLISPLFSLATLFLSSSVARLLWPARPRVEALTPFILLGLFFWMVYSTLTMFDMMLAFFALLGIYSILKLVGPGQSLKYWALLGVAIGGGVYSKGPVILLHVLPAALLAPWSLKLTEFDRRRWYLGIGVSVLIGAILALCWAIPAGFAGGETYAKEIFLGQTSGRLVESFAHRLPWWWYLEILPLLLLPWLFCKPLWLGLRKPIYNDPGIRFCLAWALPVFIAFSLISGKRFHYLLPLVPALVLVLARALDEVTESEKWQRSHVAVAVIFGVLGLALMLWPWLNDAYHWRLELSSISPLWGSVLLGVAVILAVRKARQAQDAAFYVCIISVAACLTFSGAFFQAKADRYDTAPAAQKIGELMEQNRPIAFYGSKYYGQYNFTGRLKQPVAVILPYIDDLNAWAEQHKDGYIIVTYKDAKDLPLHLIDYHYPFRNQNVGLLSCRMLLEHPELSIKFIP